MDERNPENMKIFEKNLLVFAFAPSPVAYSIKLNNSHLNERAFFASPSKVHEAHSEGVDTIYFFGLSY